MRIPKQTAAAPIAVAGPSASSRLATPVIVPRMTACAGPSPRSIALLAPVTANRL
jgi:hypothetical protein